MPKSKKYYAEIVSIEPYNWFINSKHNKEIVTRLKLLQDSTLDMCKVDFESSYHGIKLLLNENEFIICFNFTVIHYNNRLISIKFDECRSLENYILSTIPSEASDHILKRIIIV